MRIPRLPSHQRIAALCGLLTFIIAISVLIGWHFNLPVLKTIFSGYISMKVNTAIGLMLLAIAQLTLTFEKPFAAKFGVKLPSRDIIAFATFTVFLIGTLTLTEYALNANFGIDELLYLDLDAIGKPFAAGRLAPITAYCFIALGLGIGLISFGKTRHYRVAQLLFFLVTLLSFQAIASYSLGIDSTFGFAAYARIALHTAIALICVSTGLLINTIDRGYCKIIFADNQAGHSSRRLLVAAMFVPAFVNFIEIYGTRAGYFTFDSGILLRVMGTILFFVLLVLRNAQLLSLAEQEKRSVLETIVEKEKESARLVAEHDAALTREVSERKLREELVEAKSKAENAARAKAEFLANMSHEIRTPLNGIIGIADLLNETALSDQQRKYVATLVSSGAGLLSIINEVLDFSKIEAGKIELENVDFNLKTILEGQVELLLPQVRQKGLKLSMHFDPALPDFVNGDSGRIGQVLLNLIGNAIKFTANGSVTVRATPAVNRGETQVGIRFNVIDTGIGLSTAAIEKLFQPFMQADGSTSRKFGGTGLGLSICSSLVNLMGGTIGVESIEGSGSNFWFEINLNQVGEDRALAAMEAWAGSLAAESSIEGILIQVQPTFPMSLPSASGSAANSPAYNGPERRADMKPKPDLGPRTRILVAEDNTVNQMVVMAHLKKLGYEGQVVANGQEALDALQIRKFDLILMDGQMPEMDGYQATGKIREREKFSGSHIPIIALTANAMKDDRERCLAAGMDDYLAKPFKREDLQELLIKWLLTSSDAIQVLK